MLVVLMRDRDHTHEGDGDERIINPDGETQGHFKAVLDAEWGCDGPDQRSD